MMCVGEGGLIVVGLVVYVSRSVGVLMVFEWKAMGVWRDVLGWGWVCVLGADELISKFWTSCIVYMLIMSQRMTCIDRLG